MNYLLFILYLVFTRLFIGCAVLLVSSSTSASMHEFFFFFIAGTEAGCFYAEVKEREREKRWWFTRDGICEAVCHASLFPSLSRSRHFLCGWARCMYVPTYVLAICEAASLITYLPRGCYTSALSGQLKIYEEKVNWLFETQPTGICHDNVQLNYSGCWCTVCR